MRFNRVTIIGGSGFVGRYVVGPLADRGVAVTVGSRRPERAKFLQPCGNVGQIINVPVDVRDERSVEAAVQDADLVINLVGILFERGKANFSAVHVDGAERVARLSQAAGVGHYIHMSALGADAQSRSAYARSKAAGEQAVKQIFPGATILRPSIIAGPEDNFFNRFAGMTRLSPVLPLIGGGHTKFQPVYVGDLAAVISAIIDDANAAGATFEIGGPRVYSFEDLMRLILDLTGRRRWLMSIPPGLASFLAIGAGLMPVPALTRDQVRLLAVDNILTGRGENKTLADLNIRPTALEAVLESYLARYRSAGGYIATQNNRPTPSNKR